MEFAEESRLKEILHSMAERHGWRQAQWLQMLEGVWMRAVGPGVSKNTKILSLTSDGVLWVAVPSSVWAQELLYYRPRILAAIHDELPMIPIKDVRTRVRTERTRVVQATEGRKSPYYPTTWREPATDDPWVLLARVQEKYQQAAREWLDQGFQECMRCHAPTLKGYALCSVCEISRRKS